MHAATPWCACPKLLAAVHPDGISDPECAHHPLAWVGGAPRMHGSVLRAKVLDRGCLRGHGDLFVTAQLPQLPVSNVVLEYVCGCGDKLS